MFKKALIFIIAAITATFAFAQESDLSQYILTPKAPDTPRINGPKVYGARPGNDFIFRIPTSGVRPITFTAKGLPKGLVLDKENGIITGKPKRRGTYIVSIVAENALGSCERDLKIVIGDDLLLTPQMGWDSWNVWGNTISQEKMLSAARSMVEKGLADYGWSYINIDDGWQGVRGGKYNAIQPNSKFPDMKALADEIHSYGLKFGIYSGPWVGSFNGHIATGCDNPEGKYWWVEQGIIDDVYKLDRKRAKRDTVFYHGEYSFAKQDVRQWADWGVDYLKYDWHPNDLYWMKDMYYALKEVDRSIVYQVSNYCKLGLAPYLYEFTDSWRTTGDIRDNWKSMSKIGFEGQDSWAAYKRPGKWPDADMLVVGKVGWGPKTHPTKLTPDEQYTHITLWSILASPLILGCDLAELDDFTISLLCNNEVIDVNQDPLGWQASRYRGDENEVIYVKPLEDGSVAVAMFNLSEETRTIGFRLWDLGLIGTDQTVRDLWRQKDICTLKPKQRWETEVAPHGVSFVRISPGIQEIKLLGNHR